MTKIVFFLMLVLLAISCSSKKIVNPVTPKKEYTFDYELLPNSLYKIRVVEDLRGEQLNESNAVPDSLGGPIEILSMYSFLLETFEYQDEKLPLSIRIDTFKIDLFGNIFNSAFGNKVAVDTAAIFRNIESLISYGYVSDTKEIVIDSIEGEFVSLMSPEYSFGRDFTTEEIMNKLGAVEWNFQNKLPNGMLAVLDTFSYVHPELSNPYKKDTIKKEKEYIKEEMDSIIANSPIRVVESKDSLQPKMSDDNKKKRLERQEEFIQKQEERRKKREMSWKNRVHDQWTKYVLINVDSNIATFTMDHYEYFSMDDTESESFGKGELRYDLIKHHYTLMSNEKVNSNNMSLMGNGSSSHGKHVRTITIEKVK